jgi:DNA-binding LytR/AlgR family response regulator
MKIAVCDDEQSFRDTITSAVVEYSNMRRWITVIDEFICGEDLLKSKKVYDIVFLDYKLEGIDGLETAQFLREKNKNCTIIFLTSFPQFVYEAFEVGAFRFFEKPLDVSKLYKALDEYFELFGNDYPLLINAGRETVSIQAHSVVFLEADKKKCYINLSEKRFLCSMSISSVARLMPKNTFYRVHKGFIVNFNHIRNYDSEYIYFTNGQRVPVSRKYFSVFRDSFRSYVKRRAFYYI